MRVYNGRTLHQPLCLPLSPAQYGLGGPEIEPLWVRDFYTRTDRPWGLPSLLYNGYQVPFPGVKRPVCGVNHPLLSSTKVKESLEL